MLSDEVSMVIHEYFICTFCLSLIKKNSGFCSWNATYESLLGSNKPFSQRIPLSVSFFLFGEEFFQSGLITLLGNALCIFGCNEQEMIDFLADIWEQEGLYD